MRVCVRAWVRARACVCACVRARACVSVCVFACANTHLTAARQSRNKQRRRHPSGVLSTTRDGNQKLRRNQLLTAPKGKNSGVRTRVRPKAEKESTLDCSPATNAGPTARNPPKTCVRVCLRACVRAHARVRVRVRACVRACVRVHILAYIHTRFFFLFLSSNGLAMLCCLDCRLSRLSPVSTVDCFDCRESRLDSCAAGHPLTAPCP